MVEMVSEDNELYDWKPLKGIGKLPFQCPEEKIVELLGMPDAREEEVYTDDFRTVTYIYENIDIDCRYHDDTIIPGLSISCSTLILEGQNLYDLSFRQLLKYFRALWLSSLQKTDDGYSQFKAKYLLKYKRTVIHLDDDYYELCYDFPYLGATFWFEEGQMNDATVYMPDESVEEAWKNRVGSKAEEVA